MKLFGAVRETETELKKARWFGALLTFCAVLVTLAVCIEVYRRAANYGTKIVEARPINAEIVIKNPPAWLHRDIISSLLTEAYDFGRRDYATYSRVRNVLDNNVLREIAECYTGIEEIDGKTVSRQSQGFNAWIRRITSVRREVAKDQTRQTIEISAEWRSPAAWVRTSGENGDILCLIDADGVRLPGDYQLADRGRTNLMVIAGVDLPVVEGHQVLPKPGELWTAGASRQVGDEMNAGMKLASLLAKEPFAQQIDAVDVSNFNGKKDVRASWIVLNTVWQTSDGLPRVIQWGRPMGQESFYEVQAQAKLKALKDIYARFSRIDAGRDYVDIRTEIVRQPKVTSEAESPVITARG